METHQTTPDLDAEFERPTAFVAMKFDKEHIEEFEQWGTALLKAIQEAGVEPDCMVQEEGWGKTPHEHPLQEAERRIDQSEMLIMDLSQGSGFGCGAEAGYARAKGKPVIMLVSAEKQQELSSTRKDAASHILIYENFEDLTAKLTPLIMGLQVKK
ncbi:MAG: hypothetical protein UT26_C0010G0019 [Microgenomates group bacterium GW2011_GWC1_39_12]|nr:MAG: hypothetical protein UT26_C0010G0019 [Microgenomates group bacterium GW2011_GWC1_39_12]